MVKVTGGVKGTSDTAAAKRGSRPSVRSGGGKAAAAAGKRDPRIDVYIERAAPFARPILRHMRGLVHQACPEAEETIKWGMPAFVHHGLMCSMAAFKSHCAFGYWLGELVLREAGGMPSRSGEAMGDYGRITALTDLPKDSLVLRHIRYAAKLNEQGVKRKAGGVRAGEGKVAAVAEKSRTLEVPAALTKVLKGNAKARATFEAFSYSHRKEYVEWISEAKTQPTRDKRVATTVQWLEEGKFRNWKYKEERPRPYFC
jgi:uncharacterized protein YdeI (YjbR/CyaY-like superfamily)